MQFTNINARVVMNLIKTTEVEKQYRRNKIIVPAQSNATNIVLPPETVYNITYGSGSAVDCQVTPFTWILNCYLVSNGQGWQTTTLSSVTWTDGETDIAPVAITGGDYYVVEKKALLSESGSIGQLGQRYYELNSPTITIVDVGASYVDPATLEQNPIFIGETVSGAIVRVLAEFQIIDTSGSLSVDNTLFYSGGEEETLLYQLG